MFIAGEGGGHDRLVPDLPLAELPGACEMAAEASYEPPSRHVISAETSIMRLVRKASPEISFSPV